MDKFKAVAFTRIHVQVLPVQVGVIHKLVQVSLRHPHLIFASAKASLWAGKWEEVKRKHKEPGENRNESMWGALGSEKENFSPFLLSPMLPLFFYFLCSFSFPHPLKEPLRRREHPPQSETRSLLLI